MVARNKMRRAMQLGEKDKVRPGKVARTQERKESRREMQEVRHRANEVLRSMGLPTAWEKSCEFRRLQRRWVLAA